VKDLKFLHLLLCILRKHLIIGLGLLFLRPFGLGMRVTMVAKMMMMIVIIRMIMVIRMTMMMMVITMIMVMRMAM
jgi:hypothetical protein